MTIEEHYLLIRDAELLVSQYKNRNRRDLAMTIEQRKAWAAEITDVIQAMIHELESIIPERRAYDVAVVWNSEMREGRRKVTFKVPPGPAYGGVKLQPPPFVDDPTDPRGKPPRHSR